MTHHGFQKIIAVALGLSAWALTALAAPTPLTLESTRLMLRVETNGLMTLRDKLAGGEWRQALTERSAAVKLKRIEATSPTELRLELLAQQQAFTATVTLVTGGNEVELALTGETLPGHLYYPAPFLPQPDAKLILALKEGLAVPVQDTTVFFDNQKRGWFQFYEGHNAAMPFWGFANHNGSGLMTLILTPNDANFLISRQKGLLTDQVAWQGEFGRVGYPRRLRYIPLERGGYVAMAQRYRVQAQQDGLVKTLTEKIRANPNVERLLGAANVWLNDHWRHIKDHVEIARQLRGLGIERAIFNASDDWMQRMNQAEITNIHALGYLSGRYDNLQDVMAPTNFAKLTGINPVFPPLQKAWPDDIVLNADGTPLQGWPVDGKGGGKTYYCGRLSDRVRLKYAQEIVTRDLAEHSYSARFLDTEAATYWSEDYNPRHRATRSQTRAARMQVLGFLSGPSKLVTGSEGLSAYAVPHLDYFEGVGPVEPFRVPQPNEHPFKTFPADYDWGTNMTQLLEISHRYLIPLWELVFHDCVATYSRWDEANNKYAHPLWWKKEALCCALYGRPPTFMFDLAWWQNPANQQMLAEIYRQTGPLTQKVGTARMTDHRWLDATGDVQQTRFDNGVTVTVNFGHQPYTAPDGTTLSPGSVLVLP